MPRRHRRFVGDAKPLRMINGHLSGNLHSGVKSILILDSPANASRDSTIRPGIRLILDRPHTLERAGVVDRFALMTHTEHGCFPLRTDYPPNTALRLKVDCFIELPVQERDEAQDVGFG